ncbi:putative short-chain type dehydrogenase/reductase [Neofusicoccum parvum]|nr:putative short-chain type dehydrogenase/reductase [Neofusicoccum parvum]
MDSLWKLDGSGRLHNRVAIVTGSSSGMGRAIALSLAREGASVVCADLTPDAAIHGFEVDRHISTHTLIADNGGTAVFQKCDMGRTEEIFQLINTAVKTFSRLDILVNNAGVWMPLREFAQETDEMWDAIVGVNGKGTATAMREAIKQFLTQPVDPKSGARGRIVNISSCAGIVAVAREATYAASKAAVCMLTRAVALDHAKDSINVNCVCPGVVRTALSSTNFNDEKIISDMRKGTPWPRLGEPDDVAKVVLFLCSDEAQWVTGQNIAVDGGFTLLPPLSVEQVPLIRCLGLNYRDHAAEANMAIPSEPVLFIKPRTALTGPHPQKIVVPQIAQDGSSDYEAELTVILSKTGRDIPEEEALDYVLGYTCGNDISARNQQFKNSQWCFSKGLDYSAPIGPTLVAPAALSDPLHANIKAIHNGRVVQDSNSQEMIFTVAKTIAFLSQGTTLEQGTVIMTGTPPGIGCMRNPRVVLNHGDDMRVFIEGIGTLINEIYYE